MIDFETWIKAVDDFDTYYNKKRARVTCVDGEVYEGVCKGYREEDDSKGNSVWGISISQTILIQEDVEKIEFLD